MTPNAGQNIKSGAKFPNFQSFQTFLGYKEKDAQLKDYYQIETNPEGHVDIMLSRSNTNELL